MNQPRRQPDHSSSESRRGVLPPFGALLGTSIQAAVLTSVFSACMAPGSNSQGGQPRFATTEMAINSEGGVESLNIAPSRENIGVVNGRPVLFRINGLNRGNEGSMTMSFIDIHGGGTALSEAELSLVDLVPDVQNPTLMDALAIPMQNAGTMLFVESGNRLLAAPLHEIDGEYSVNPNERIVPNINPVGMRSVTLKGADGEPVERLMVLNPPNITIIDGNAQVESNHPVSADLRNAMLENGLPDITFDPENDVYRMVVQGPMGARGELREIRFTTIPADLQIEEAILQMLQGDSEPVRDANNQPIRGENPMWIDANTVMFFSPGESTLKVVRLAQDPVIPPVDAAVQDAAPEDGGVQDSAAPDAGGPDAEIVDAAAPDAEVSPEDSGPGAEVSQPDAAPADMSVSPDMMTPPDAEPDGGMVEADQGIPDEGVDQPIACGDNVCSVTESVESCLIDCFRGFSVSAGECTINVNLLDQHTLTLDGEGRIDDRCIAEFQVPGFNSPVRYIVSAENGVESGRLEFEGVIFLDNDGQAMIGTAIWGGNVNTVVNLDEDGQGWLVGNPAGLSLAGTATKIFLQKIEDEGEGGDQIWKAVNGNSIMEGPVLAFGPDGNVVAVIPPAATFNFRVNESNRRVEIENVEDTQDPAEAGIKVVGGASLFSDCSVNTGKDKGTPLGLVLLVALAVRRRRNS